MRKDMYYTTIGQTRGSCGHNHQTFRKAFDCLVQDWLHCKKHAKKGDRIIRRVRNGKHFPISDREFNSLKRLLDVQ